MQWWGGAEQEIISSILSEVLEFQVSCSQIRREITSGNKRLKAGVEVSEGASTNTYLGVPRAQPHGPCREARRRETRRRPYTN